MFFRTDKHQERAEQAQEGASTDGGSGEEAQLIEAARRLEDGAWAQIYQRHSEQVYSYIYYRLGDQHTAEDLTADVFVKAIAGIRGYSYRGTPFLAWLYRIAHNVTMDHRKSAARRMRHRATEDTEEIEERVDHLGMLDARSDMMNALRELTGEQQQVIILRFYHGMSNADVARVMKKPEGAVKALQSRGLRSLRRVLAEREDGRASA